MHLGYRKTFLVINFLRLIHLEIILKEFVLAQHNGNENQSNRPQSGRLFSQEITNKVEILQATRTDKTLFTSDDKQNKGTIPMLTYAGRTSTMSSLIPVEFQQNSMVDSKEQISELQFDKGKYDSKIK